MKFESRTFLKSATTAAAAIFSFPQHVRFYFSSISSDSFSLTHDLNKKVGRSIKVAFLSVLLTDY